MIYHMSTYSMYTLVCIIKLWYSLLKEADNSTDTAVITKFEFVYNTEYSKQ